METAHPVRPVKKKKLKENLKRLLKSEDAFLRIMPTVNPNSSKITFSNRWHPIFQRDHIFRISGHGVLALPATDCLVLRLFSAEKLRGHLLRHLQAFQHQLIIWQEAMLKI